MAIFRFLNKTWGNLKYAVAQHPIEILLTTIFAVPLLFIDILYHLQHRAYWIFTPVFLIVVYLFRQTKWYKFSWLVPALSCVILWYFNDNAEIYLTSPKFWGLNCIMIIILFSMPFQRENQSYISDALSTVFNVLFASLTGWLISGIIFAVMESIEMLFGSTINGELQSRIVIFSCYFFIPLFFLAYQQRQSNKLTLERWLDILLSFVAAPALMLFTVILYVYVVKIIMDGELPQGMVANIVLPYVTIGLAIYCLRTISEKPRWNTFFHWYPYLAIIPFVLLWFAIKSRISAYAWTEDRIYLVALASVLSICYIIVMLPKLRQYRNLALIIIVAIFTMTFVLNPKQIAYDSQVTRFEKALERLNVLQNGKIRSDFNVKKDLSKIPESQVKDWQMIRELAGYLFYNLERPLEMDQNWSAETIFSTKYGPQFSELRRIYIYSDGRITLDDEMISNEIVSSIVYKRETNLDININGFKRLVYWEEFINRNENFWDQSSPYKSLPFCLVTDEESCWDLDEMIREAFSKHKLDPMVRHSRDILEPLNADLLNFTDKNGNKLLLGDIRIVFLEGQGYVLSNTSRVMVLMK